MNCLIVMLIWAAFVIVVFYVVPRKRRPKTLSEAAELLALRDKFHTSHFLNKAESKRMDDLIGKLVQAVKARGGQSERNRTR